MFMRVTTGLLYGLASFFIVLINKTVLTTYKFPSFQMLALGQITASIVILAVGKALRIVSYPGLSGDTFWKIWPLPLFFIGNMLFGLGGTQSLSLPMLTGTEDDRMSPLAFLYSVISIYYTFLGNGHLYI